MNAGGVPNTCKSSAIKWSGDFGQSEAYESGGRVSNAWATCPIQRDSLGKPGLKPHNAESSHGLSAKDSSVWDGPASD